jgi:cytoskeletal protein CcmA (bactofilin family)
MTEPVSNDRTFFSAGSRIEGTLELEGEVKLDGQISGKVAGTGVIVIGEHANLQADVSAPMIVVHGVVRGELRATDRLELHRTAKVKGVISAPRLRVDEGAVFEGECKMAIKDAAKVDAPRAEEKRAGGLSLTPSPATQTSPGAQAPKIVTQR